MGAQRALKIPKVFVLGDVPAVLRQLHAIGNPYGNRAAAVLPKVDNPPYSLGFFIFMVGSLLKKVYKNNSQRK